MDGIAIRSRDTAARQNTNEDLAPSSTGIGSALRSKVTFLLDRRFQSGVSRPDYIDPFAENDIKGPKTSDLRLMHQGIVYPDRMAIANRAVIVGSVAQGFSR